MQRGRRWTFNEQIIRDVEGDIKHYLEKEIGWRREQKNI